MRYLNLPGTQKQASAVVLGTAWFGTAIAEDQAFALLDAYLAQGGNFLDTAHMYASWVKGGAGKSETTLGNWLQRVGRERVVLATKGADLGMTRDGIRRQLTESLERLRQPSVDFYFLHRDDPQVPVGEIITWLNELVKEGRFSAFGCSNWVPARIAAAQAYAQTHGLRGFSGNQVGYSLARVKPEVKTGGMLFMDDATHAYHCESKLAVMAYSSQAGGFFGGAYGPNGPPAGMKANPAIVNLYGTPRNYRLQAACEQIAKARGATPNQVSLACLLQQPFPCFVIAGANSPERVADSCGAGKFLLSPAEMAALDQA